MQSSTQFVFAAVGITSAGAFSGRCGYHPAVGGAMATSSGFTVTIHAFQATATSALD